MSELEVTLNLKIGDDVPNDGFRLAVAALATHLIFKPLILQTEIIRVKGNLCPSRGWAIVTSNGRIHASPSRETSESEWTYIIGHCLLHLGFGHHNASKSLGVQDGIRMREWNAACDCFVARFLEDLAVGTPPDDMQAITNFVARSETQLYNEFCSSGALENLHSTGTAGRKAGDILSEAQKLDWRGLEPEWSALLGQGMTELATQRFSENAFRYEADSPARRAREWFVRNFPLLSSLATAFQVVEDDGLCNRLGIEVAAVEAWSRRIFVNPKIKLSDNEWRFVIGHELLHVGLQHHERWNRRDAFLWNIACDYIINDWLLEMEVGKMPKIGGLYNREFHGLSAEEVYKKILKRAKYRNLASFRGTGSCDMLQPGESPWHGQTSVVDLNDFYRKKMQEGLARHQTFGRGLLPAGLVSEIVQLTQPAPPWDVELARWLDSQFPPVEVHRTYARPSRRQSSTPDIPRPSVTPPEGIEETGTLGVVLDTSGSMDDYLLGRAFGAIASFCMGRNIPAVRLILCDATPYDKGYVTNADLCGEVQIEGRGGTVLQPAIDLLETVDDFPKDGPILVITDGGCDILTIKREHAFLLPENMGLPFEPVGKVFWMS